MDLRIHRLWLLVLALLLAMLIGPPAHAQPIESSLGTYPLPRVVGMSGDEPFSVVVTVDHHATYDSRGIQFFELKTQTGSVAISADADAAFAKVLTASAGKRVRVTVEPYTVREIAR